ncbi:hypothetical protein AAZX31_09G124000 [Glycine max]
MYSLSVSLSFLLLHSFPIRLKPACQSSFQRDYSDLNSRYNSNRIWYKKE